MTDTRTETAASLLHLVDRAERGSLLAEEAQQLRAGIRALGGRDQEMEELRARVAELEQQVEPETFEDGGVNDIRELYAAQEAITASGGQLTRPVHRAIDAIRARWDIALRREQQRREEVEADLARVQQAACRTAEALRKAERKRERPCTTELHTCDSRHAWEYAKGFGRRARAAEAAIDRVRQLLVDDPSGIYSDNEILAALDEQQPTTEEREAAAAYAQALNAPPSEAVCAAIRSRLQSGEAPRRQVRIPADSNELQPPTT
ncbi:hypothetical protein [Streptomyces sp. 900116325]